MTATMNDILELVERAKGIPSEVPLPLHEMCSNEGYEPWWSPKNPSYQQYYFFCYLYAQKFKPMVFAELGLELGRCTAFVAHGSPETKCFGIEMLGPDTHHWQKWLRPLPNVAIVPMTTSQDWLRANKGMRVDFAHIDSDHTYETAIDEWTLLRPLMTPGSIVCFDDTAATGVRWVWELIDDEKIVTNLHGDHGWGICLL